MAMYEVKCSKRTFYAHPQIGHLCQVHQQMWVRDRRYAVLHYFHHGATRMWLVRFSADFWLWCRRRMTLHRAHRERLVPPSRESPYFRWLTHGAEWSYTNTVGKWLHREWYTHDGHTGKPLRAPCTADDWRAELTSLGFANDAEFAAAISGGADVVPRGECDAAQLSTPPEPDSWLMYERATPPPLPSHVPLFDSDTWVPDPRDAYTSVVEWARAQFAAGADLEPYSPTIRMRRLFVSEVLPAPEYDEPEPEDMCGRETPEELAEFTRRLAELEARPRRERGGAVAAAAAAPRPIPAAKRRALQSL